MPLVTGQFDTKLTTPITLWPEVKQADLATCDYEISNAKVQLRPLNITPLVDYGVHNGELIFDFPELTEIRVWVLRDTQITQDRDGRQIIPRDEEVEFERLLVQATRRFATAAKLKIGWPSLETKHPVHSYRPSYTYESRSIGTAFPSQPDSWKFPEYVLDSIGFETYPEVTSELWKEIAQLTEQASEIAPYEELIYDAKAFQASMHYEVAALFAGIAAELMLEEAALRLLKKNGNFTDKQCSVILGNRRIPELVGLISTLDPSARIGSKELNDLPKLRNDIAHGKRRTLTGEESFRAIRTIEDLKRKLAPVLQATS